MYSFLSGLLFFIKGLSANERGQLDEVDLCIGPNGDDFVELLDLAVVDQDKKAVAFERIQGDLGVSFPIQFVGAVPFFPVERSLDFRGLNESQSLYERHCTVG